MRAPQSVGQWLADDPGRWQPERKTTGLTVRDGLTDDVEAAMQRVVVRRPYLTDMFSRKRVNHAFRASQHREFMSQQM